MTVFALLVGIDEYRAVPGLRGCVNDVEAVAAHLNATVEHVSALVLTNGRATRAAIVAAIREHLGRAGRHDTALFWFSGHGSDADAPDWVGGLEPARRVQTLVCADSRAGGVPDLWDKELAVLLDEVAARGPHVTVVLDSCHSDGASRGPRLPPTALTRAVGEAGARDPGSFLPGTIERAAAVPPMGWVELAACHSFETAREMLVDGRVRHGVFTWSLLRALRRLGAAASYAALLDAARTEVDRYSFQSPQARPRDSPRLDETFLGAGPARRDGDGIRMRYTGEGWTIDAGAVHGVPPGDGARVGVHGEAAGREAEIIAVRPEQSLVEPVSPWWPDRDEQFRVVLTSVPLPPATVALTVADPGLRDTLSTAIAASPLLRPMPADGTGVPGLWVTAAHGRLEIADQHGDLLEERELRGRYAVTEAVVCLEHIARWRRTWELTNETSRLRAPVGIEIVDAGTGLALAPDDRGEYVARYRPGGHLWEPPRVRMRLRNHSGLALWCVLLDLTARFQVHSDLFPGDFLAPGATADCLDGRVISASLPPGSRIEPGASTRDRLKLVVAEQQFSARPFHQPRLGRRPGAERGFPGSAPHRDLTDADLPTGYDWTTGEAVFRTEVPL
ncbi:caspase family protein [Actinoplanes sp. G11-F43]|uniref:caspase family protein n=1 Tax=Actinoplanes sp. G11-F43 TaxID=3424130 RepID=UPI003D32D4BE